MVAPHILAYPAPPVRAQPTAAQLNDRARFGLLIYLTSKTMFFVALVSAYVVLATSREWPPAEAPPIEIAAALPGTLLLVLSAATVLLATRGVRRDDQRGVLLGLTLTPALGVMFALLQAGEWRAQLAAGLQHTPYGQFYFVLTAFHMLYIVTGLGIFAFVLRRALLGRYGPERRTGVELSALWWHFCGGVWALLFYAIYLMPEH